MKKIRLTGLGKVVFTLMGIALITIAIAFIGFMDSKASLTKEYKEVVVRQGQSLWMIADKYKNENSDTRSMIYEIKELNDLASSDVYDGQVLRIPILK